LIGIRDRKSGTNISYPQHCSVPGIFYNYLLFILVRKLKFHERYAAFPGSLAMDKEALMMVGNNDAGSFYEMCIEFLDYLEDIINLETGVFESLGLFVSFFAFSLPLIIWSRWPLPDPNPDVT
jgi:hypothetical protein